MSAARPIPWETKQDQWRASDPKLSAWVSAHAGSGKTHVLSQRVVRLLLARVPPSRILCLTYTKAAAANMAARIFDILAKWTLLDDDALDNAVEKASGRRLDPAERDFARRLFARTVETPGGLKVQTIHAFCERILHLFPFEANVPAGFRIIDDIERGALLADARKETLDRALNEDDCLRDALATVARDASEATFDGLIGELLHHRGALRGVARGEDYERDLRRRLGLAEGETLADIEARMIDGGIASKDWAALDERLRQGGKRDAGLADQLMQAAKLAPDPACIDDYLLVFFTQKGGPRGGDATIITSGLCKKDPELLALLEQERERLAALIDKRKTAATYARSLALARIGEAIVSSYERMKNHRGLFDFDDLIKRTRELLRRSSPSWVLYKLDQRIDHILLDEAQDTSAPQWEILQVIANEFAQATRPRSFFAVGDEKQSIFSFQGAAPEKFDAMRRGFENRFHAAKLPFEHVRLTLSFRSAPTILASVDAIFGFGDNRLGLSYDPTEPAPEHTAWKSNAAGLVEIWDPIRPNKLDESKDWKLPLDFVGVDDPAARLARKVARKIASLLDLNNGEWVEDKNGPRAITPGDLLILVRKRDAFFEAIIRALKEQHIPVAGADRLDLMNHIAVMDLCALGRAALLPEDGVFAYPAAPADFGGFRRALHRVLLRGIPHPPGYPFWAIYSWLWTKLLVVGNVAWRVEVGEATAAALACGLLAFMVSRGSSMFMEGIEELRNIAGKWENIICVVSGTVAGLLLGLGSVMWSESVAINRISPFGVPWLMTVLVCLLRWIYAPHQRGYLYTAMFFFGICATIHQTLIVAAMGTEAAVIATQPRLGRDLSLGNSIVYALGVIAE